MFGRAYTGCSDDPDAADAINEQSIDVVQARSPRVVDGQEQEWQGAFHAKFVQLWDLLSISMHTEWNDCPRIWTVLPYNSQ